jgi:hypothetical protein
MTFAAAMLATLGAGFAALLWHQHRQAARQYRPLATRQPARAEAPETPLGMEATDLGHVARTTRANETLERGTTNWMRALDGTFASRAAETDIAPWADDATYAARYHAAFHREDKDSLR